jgi:putative membrane-bound dehydrogenase-like protein
MKGFIVITAFLAASLHAQPAPSHPLPPGVVLKDDQGSDNGVRFVDLNEDGHDDIVFSNTHLYGIYLFNPTEKKNVDWRVGWTFVMREGTAGDANSIPPIVDANGSDAGITFKDRAMHLPDGRRIAFTELMRQPGPPPRSPEESLKALHVKPGFTAELVASEPLVQDPVFIDWGADGRMWVVEMGDYPFHEHNGKVHAGRVKFLEDTNGDGIYDKATTFLDGLTYPTGLAPWKNGVFVASVPDVFFAEDTNNDGKADKRTPILTGFAKGNPQHLVNGFCWGLDGWFYGGNGDSGGKVVEVKSGREFDLSGRDFRFNPRTGEFQLQAGRTQYGRWRDDFGNWFGCNNSSLGWHYLMDERYLARNPQLAVPTLRRTLNADKQVFPASTPLRRFNWPDAVNTLTSGCNAMPYRDNLFGDEYAHSYFICEPANNLVHREVLEPDGISFRSHRAADEQGKEFLASEDNWSRFTMARTGPDGCLYVVDFCRLILEHPEWIPKLMLEHLDLRAGEDKGRIYRIVPERRQVLRDRSKLPLFPWACEDGMGWEAKSSTTLTVHLLGANGWCADTAQRMLIERNAREVATILGEYVVRGDSGERPMSPRQQVRVLWTLRTLDELKPAHVMAAFRNRFAEVRRASVELAENFLGESGIVERVAQLADDSDLRVRLQVALTLGESEDPRVPDVLRAIARRDAGNKDMLMALLSSLPKHAAALAEDAKDWQTALRSGGDSSAKPAPQVITNINADREKVVKQYASVATLTGDAARGHALYANVCSACHRLKGEGQEIGPDLGTVAAKPTEQLVEAILDPNRAVEARYTTQTITTKQGREVTGLVMEETANSLTVRIATGNEVILRSDIAKRTGTSKSLMMEGLETLLTPQHVADVIAWMRSK